MFTRLVEMTSKSGKSQELANTINEKAVPILKKQHGFGGTRLCSFRLPSPIAFCFFRIGTAFSLMVWQAPAISLICWSFPLSV